MARGVTVEMADIVSRGIVLGSVRYGDRARVVDVYTEAVGTRAFFVPASGCREMGRRVQGVGKVGAGSLRSRCTPSSALFSPLAVVEIGWHEGGSGGGELSRLREVAMAHAWRELYFRPQKSAVVMFLSEFLGYALRGEVGDPRLMSYLTTSLAWLDEAERGVGVFPITFLMGLAQWLGFDVRGGVWRKGSYFDLLSGSYESTQPAHSYFLTPEETALVPKFLGVPVSMSGRVRVPRWVLQRALTVVVDFYRLHLPSMPERLRTLEVLAQL